MNTTLARLVTQSAPADVQTELGHSVARLVPGQRWSPQLKDRECDNARPRLAYCTVRVMEQWRMITSTVRHKKHAEKICTIVNWFTRRCTHTHTGNEPETAR